MIRMKSVYQHEKLSIDCNVMNTEIIQRIMLNINLKLKHVSCFPYQSLRRCKIMKMVSLCFVFFFDVYIKTLYLYGI